MKRLTALALTLVMLLLLFLTGCADTKQNGDRLQDKLNTKQLPETQEPAQTDPPDTTQTPTSGKTPSKGSTAQRPGKPGPEEGAPSGDGYSMYEGIYVDDQTDADITTVLELHAYSDILLLEYSYLSDGVLFGTWGEEFWPDPDVFEDGKLESVCGAYQGFNIIESTCDYTQAWSHSRFPFLEVPLDAPFLVLTGRAAFFLRVGSQNGHHQFTITTQGANVLLLKENVHPPGFEITDGLQQRDRISCG